MADRPYVEYFVIGDDRLALKFKGLNRVVREELKAATRDSADWLASSAKMHAPVDTGRLRGAIKGFTDLRGGLFTSGGGRINHYEAGVEVGPEAPYGVYVEEGTGIYHQPDRHSPWLGPVFGHWSSKLDYAFLGNRPQPFIAPAVEDNRVRINRRFDEAGHRIRLRLET